MELVKNIQWDTRRPVVSRFLCNLLQLYACDGRRYVAELIFLPGQKMMCSSKPIPVKKAIQKMDGFFDCYIFTLYVNIPSP